MASFLDTLPHQHIKVTWNLVVSLHLLHRMASNRFVFIKKLVLCTGILCVYSSRICVYLLQNKRDEHILKRRNVPAQDSTDSEENERPMTQSLETIVQNASSDQPAVQLSAVQAARYCCHVVITDYELISKACCISSVSKYNRIFGL